MALQDAIKRLRYIFTSEGAEKVASDMQKVNVTQTQSTQASLSQEQAFAKLERRFVEGVKAQQDYAAIQAKVNAAVAANPALQERATAVLASAAARLDQTTAAQRAFATATSGVSGQLIALSAGAGPVGVFLSALGPMGVAAAAGIGLVGAAISHMREEADRIGTKAVELRKLSEVSGLSTEQIRGLTKEGAKLGVGMEGIETAVGRFTVGLEEAHKATGDLYEKIREIDPALAKQLSETRTTAAGWDLYAQALKRAKDAGDVSQTNALARAGFGRGGLEAAQVAIATAGAGGLTAVGNQIKEITGLTNEWTEKVAKLKLENDIIEKQIANMKANAYAAEVLERQNQFLKTQREIAAVILSMGKGGSLNLPSPANDATYQEMDAARSSRRRIRPAGNSLGAAAGLGDISGPDPQAIAGWQALDNAIAGASRSMKEFQDAGARAINREKERIGALGEFADSLDKAKLKQMELDQARATGKIGLEDWLRVNQAIQQQIDYLDRLKKQYGDVALEKTKLQQTELNANLNAGTINPAQYELVNKQLQDQIASLTVIKEKYGGISSDIAAQAQGIQNQINLAAEIIPVKAQQIAYEQTITTLMGQGRNMAEAILIAEQQRALAVTQANAEADKQLKSLKDEYEVIQASTEAEKDRIKARQEYNNLIDKGVDEERAAAIRNQMNTNAGLRDTTQSWSVIHDQSVLAANAAANMAQSTRDIANDMNRAERDARGLADKLFGAFNAVPLWNPYVEGKDSWLNSTTQFNPAGYASTVGPNPMSLATSLGGPARDPRTGLPTAQSLTDMVNVILGKNGSVTDAINKLLSGTGGFGSTGLDSTSLQLVQQLTDFLPDNQKADVINRELAALKSQPQNIETLSAIKQLTDSLDQLKSATDANTQALTDVLSPLYATDTRQTHQGFRALATGAVVMSETYARIAENEPEVVAPLSALPQLLRQAANNNTPQNNQPRPIVVNVSMTANVSRDEARKTGFQIAHQMKRALG